METPDLLSGFELAGASNSHVRTRSRSNSSTGSNNARNAAARAGVGGGPGGGGPGAGAGDASDMFAGFAPPVVYPAPGASEWVMVGPGSEEQGLAPGIYGESEGWGKVAGCNGKSVGRVGW